MASSANLRLRRTAAQLHALAGVEREIKAQDSHGRRKYLREFTQAFQSYEQIIWAADVHEAVRAADIVLVGDYHALPASQRFAASLLEQRAMAGDRPVVLGVETIFARDQHVLDEWWRREIEEAELRQRIRFDLDWGYDWEPFYELLTTARDHGEGIYGLDCMPRENLRQIGARDRHAAAKIAEILQRHPGAVVFGLFGESHLASQHLPKLVRRQIPQAKVIGILQNIDALYWKAAGENLNQVEAVKISEEELCVFNTTPLEKYESYRLFLDQWSRCESEPDFAPTVYNLIKSLVSFLGINQYSAHNSPQPKFLVDLLPEVHSKCSEAMLARLLARGALDLAQVEDLLTSVRERGCAYVPRLNAFWITEFHLDHAAENAARFLHQACQGLPQRANVGEVKEVQHDCDRRGEFYRLIVENTLADLGSRVLCPARIDPVDGFVVSKAMLERAARSARQTDGSEMRRTARRLGYRLGSRLYAVYLAGKLRPAALRRLFLAPLKPAEAAREVCNAMVLATRR